MKTQKKSIPDAEFKCQKCNFKWQVPAAPVSCPKCGHGNIDWLNWEKIVDIVYENK